MNKISWKHHYLPVFYLKGFTKDSGNIKIFDVEKKRFLQYGKEFSPESYFFEKDANTISFGDNKSDFLEYSYGKFENKVSKLIEIINNSDYTTKHGVTEKEMPILNHFVSMMYWRLPHRTEEINNIVEKNSLSNLGVNFQSSDGTINLEKGEEFKNTPQFKKTYKFYNSLMDSVRGKNCRTPFSIIDKNNSLPYLCSDNPVIFEKEFSPKVYEDDYVFPLTGKRIFLRCNRREKFDHYLWLLVDTIVYKQAVKYVSCTNEEYIELLENNFIKYNLTLEELRTYLFEKIR